MNELLDRSNYFSTPQVEFYQGHCLDILKSLPDESIDSCITSPPYFQLRDYKTTPQVWGRKSGCNCQWGNLHHQREVREKICHGKSRTSDRYYQTPSRNFNGNHQKHSCGKICKHCGAWCGELGQEPNVELYITHLVEVFEQVRRILKSDGTFWLNLGDSYTSKNLNLLPHRVAIALVDNGWICRSDIVWAKPNSMPDSTKDRVTRSHEYVFLFAKSPKYYYDADAISEACSFNRWGGDKFAPATNSKLIRHNTRGLNRSRSMFGTGKRNRRSVWNVCTEPSPLAHFATMPTELARLCLVSGCREGGTVIDPFLGSGTVALVAQEFNRKVIGIDLNNEYLSLASQRCGQTTIWGYLNSR